MQPKGGHNRPVEHLPLGPDGLSLRLTNDSQHNMTHQTPPLPCSVFRRIYREDSIETPIPLLGHEPFKPYFNIRAHHRNRIDNHTSTTSAQLQYLEEPQPVRLIPVLYSRSYMLKLTISQCRCKFPIPTLTPHLHHHHRNLLTIPILTSTI
jgi:hypothetical protein